MNKDHRKTGCVRFLRRDNNAFHFSDKKIGGLQPTGDALESGTGLNDHFFLAYRTIRSSLCSPDKEKKKSVDHFRMKVLDILSKLWILMAMVRTIFSLEFQDIQKY